MILKTLKGPGKELRGRRAQTPPSVQTSASVVTCSITSEEHQCFLVSNAKFRRGHTTMVHANEIPGPYLKKREKVVLDAETSGVLRGIFTKTDREGVKQEQVWSGVVGVEDGGRNFVVDAHAVSRTGLVLLLLRRESENASGFGIDAEHLACFRRMSLVGPAALLPLQVPPLQVVLLLAVCRLALV